MKKLIKIQLHGAVELTDVTMKSIFGGSGAGPSDYCYAKCKVKAADGTETETNMGVLCPGDCSATDYVGVTCTVNGKVEPTPCPGVLSSGILM